MPSFVEQHQRFTFDDRKWVVVKYDEHRDFLERIAKLQGTKAVDFVALHNGEDGDLYWIEVKDFRGYRIENRPRLSSGELALEVGRKVRDSVAGVAGAYSSSGEWEEWKPFMKAAWRRRCKIRVLLCLEEDDMPGPAARRQNAAQVQVRLLKETLRWLTARVCVIGQSIGGLPDGLVVDDLPGAGQA